MRISSNKLLLFRYIPLSFCSCLHLEHRIASFGGFFVFFFFMHSASMAKISCKELQSIQEDIFCLEGYHSFPTEEEYTRLREEYPMVSKKETAHARYVPSSLAHKRRSNTKITLAEHQIIYTYLSILSVSCGGFIFAACTDEGFPPDLVAGGLNIVRVAADSKCGCCFIWILSISYLCPSPRMRRQQYSYFLSFCRTCPPLSLCPPTSLEHSVSLCVGIQTAEHP
jgi:hypothetical protein